MFSSPATPVPRNENGKKNAKSFRKIAVFVNYAKQSRRIASGRRRATKAFPPKIHRFFPSEITAAAAADGSSTRPAVGETVLVAVRARQEHTHTHTYMPCRGREVFGALSTERTETRRREGAGGWYRGREMAVRYAGRLFRRLWHKCVRARAARFAARPLRPIFPP